MKKILLLISLLLFVSLLLASCKAPDRGQDGTDPEPNTEEKENLIYDTKSKLYLVYDPEQLPADRAQRIIEAFFAQQVYIQPISQDTEPKEHEIVIGDVGRSISNTAYSQLNRIDLSSDSDLRYCICSDGSSLALAYDEDRDGYGFDVAVNTLIEKYVSEELVLAKGTYNKTAFDLYEYLGELDAKKYSEQWKALSERYSSDVVTALRNFYGIYDGEALVTWLANLYDPSICVCKGLYGEDECSGENPVCGTGGFYFSNSARDNLGFLPDVESTLQALGMLGALRMGTSSYVELLPEEMGEAIADFAYNLQDEDGFFYHPQWGKNISTSRRGRDFNWSKNILTAYSRSSKYPLADGSTILPASYGMTSYLGASHVSAVSKAVAAADATPSHLSTPEAFKNYLENELDFINAAYPAGNELASQSSQIRSRGEEYVKIMFDHLNSTQNVNGTWHNTPGYYAVNGLMKISGIYKDFGVEMPRAEQACLACFDAIMSKDKPGGIVDIWNAWVAITYVFENVRLFAEDGYSKETLLKENLVKNSVGAIDATREKTVKYLREDGSYGYYSDRNCLTSQGASVAVNTVPTEGDVNGCMIATTQMISFVFSGLGMSSYNVDLCGLKERTILLDILEDLSPAVKNNSDLTADPLDFDYEDLGDIPEEITVSIPTPGAGSSVQVEDDPRSGMDGNILSFVTESGSFDSISFSNAGSAVTANSFVFESEMCIARASASTDFLRLEMGKSNDISGVYRISFRQNGDMLEIYDNSSSDSANCMVNRLGAAVKEGEWFKLRIEFYPMEGSEQTVRAKVYFNDKLLSVSDNYYDYYGKKLVGEGKPNTDATLTRIQFLTAASSELLLDNVNAYYSRDIYRIEELHEDYAGAPYALNVDKVYAEAPSYTFADGNIPSDFTVNVSGGTAEVSDGAMDLSDGASVDIPAHKTASFANAAVISMDINVSGDAAGAVGSIELLQVGKKNGRISSYILKAETVEGNKVLTLSDADSGKAVSGFNIPLSKTSNIKIEYYYKDKVALFYLDGEIMGMRTAFPAESFKNVFNGIRVTGNTHLSIDNIMVEHGSKDYTSTVTPKYDSITHDFENGFGDITASGNGAVIKTGKDGSYLEMASSASSVKVPFNKRDDIMNVSIAQIELAFVNTQRTGLNFISLTDKNGERIVSFAIGQKGGKAYIYENTALGTHKAAMAEFDAVSGAVITVELYESLGICKLLADGVPMISGALLYSKANSELTPQLLTVETSGTAAGIRLDNIVFDRMRKIYIKDDIENKEELAEQITFDYSSGNDYPSAVTSSIKSSASLPAVDEAIKNGVLDKVLRIDTVSGAGDELRIEQTSPLSGAASWVFEAEIMFPEEGTAPFQIYVCDKSGNIVTIYYFTVKSSEVYFYHQTSDNKPTEQFKIGKLGEWIDFRFEYYATGEGGKAVPKIKTYIGGKFITEFGAQYPRADMSSVGRVTFYGLSGSTGSMYIDNVSLVGSTATYTP